MTAAKKMTAYGAVVVAALVMGFALLATASAAPATVDQAVTVTDAVGSTNITLTATDNSGSLAAGTEGAFSIVTAPSNGTASVSNVGVANLTTTLTADAGTTATTLTVASTANFPSSGHLFIDDPATAIVTTTGVLPAMDALDEVVSYTGKTSTTFTGVTRGVGETSGSNNLATAVVHPVSYSTIAIAPTAIGGGSVNLSDASGFITPVSPATASIVFLTTPEANTYAGKTGNALTTLDDGGPPGPLAVHAVGEGVIQFGWKVDTGTIAYDPNAEFVGADSLVQAYSLVAANRTVSITVISDLPVAEDVTANITATLPVALPTILNFVGTDSSAVAGGSTLQFTALPQKGLLTSTTPTLTCTNVTGAVIGEVMTNCSAATVYTPLLGASGTDTFTYTITNGGNTSAAATVTVTNGAAPPSTGLGFTPAIVAGFNLTAYNGGTLAQLAIDAAAGGATTVSVTVAGNFLIHVVGAPAFVNAAFAANFADGTVPAGTLVFVISAS